MKRIYGCLIFNAKCLIENIASNLLSDSVSDNLTCPLENVDWDPLQKTSVKNYTV